jgi:8-oxo-dGTP diphosphatase
MITGSEPQNSLAYHQKLLSHLDRGIQFIQFRAKHLAKREYCQLAEGILRAAESYQAQIMLNCEPHWLRHLNATGLHINSRLLMQLSKRPVSSNFIISAACHNEEQLVQAQTIGIDFVTLSPVQSTPTHPEVNPLGWDLFASLCQSIKLPIYALGGMAETELEKAHAHGAYGIAAIRSLWDKQ